MKTNNVMIDLETLGTTQSAIVPIIGACIFNPETGEIGDKFYAHLDQKEQENNGRTTDPATIDWWRRQSDAAKKEILKPGNPVEGVLSDFAKFIPKKGCVWGNGATFDVSILENMYRMWDMKPPWAFWDVRDVRTIVSLASALPTPRRVEKHQTPFIGVMHNALDDAVHQAGYVAAMWQGLTK